MAVVIPDCGGLLLLQWALQSTTTPENLTLKLYTNSYSPIASSVAADFTEATFTGYVAKTLSRATWGNPTQSGTAAQSLYSQLTWTNTGSSQTIYGIYVVGATSGTLIFAEAFDAAFAASTGSTINYTPALTLDSATNP